MENANIKTVVLRKVLNEKLADRKNTIVYRDANNNLKTRKETSLLARLRFRLRHNTVRSAELIRNYHNALQRIAVTPIQQLHIAIRRHLDPLTAINRSSKTREFANKANQLVEDIVNKIDPKIFFERLKTSKTLRILRTSKERFLSVKTILCKRNP